MGRTRADHSHRTRAARLQKRSGSGSGPRTRPGRAELQLALWAGLVSLGAGLVTVWLGVDEFRSTGRIVVYLRPGFTSIATGVIALLAYIAGRRAGRRGARPRPWSQ